MGAGGFCCIPDERTRKLHRGIIGTFEFLLPFRNISMTEYFNRMNNIVGKKVQECKNDPEMLQRMNTEKMRDQAMKITIKEFKDEFI